MYIQLRYFFKKIPVAITQVEIRRNKHDTMYLLVINTIEGPHMIWRTCWA
jgi:hypothetical protein